MALPLVPAALLAALRVGKAVAPLIKKYGASLVKAATKKLQTRSKADTKRLYDAQAKIREMAKKEKMRVSTFKQKNPKNPAVKTARSILNKKPQGGFRHADGELKGPPPGGYNRFGSMMKELRKEMK